MLCCSSAQVLWTMQTHQTCPPSRITPLEYALTKNAPVSPVECALTESLGLNSLGINTYIKKGGVGGSPPWALGAIRALCVSVAGGRAYLRCGRNAPTWG